MVWACAVKISNHRGKKCMECEVEGVRLRVRPKKTRTKIVQKDCQAHKLNGRMPCIVTDGGSI